MALVKCQNGHFYDSEKYRECPYCRIAPEEMGSGEEDRTLAWEDENQRTVGYEELSDGQDQTIGVSFTGLGRPVVGWLVCMEGPERGRDYRLCAGRNYAGRALGADIMVEDMEVSPKNHFSVVYDEKHNAFLVVPGEGTLTYLEEEILTEARPLSDDMRIRAGKSTFVFRSFCREGVGWNETL